MSVARSASPASSGPAIPSSPCFATTARATRPSCSIRNTFVPRDYRCRHGWSAVRPSRCRSRKFDERATRRPWIRRTQSGWASRACCSRCVLRHHVLFRDARRDAAAAGEPHMVQPPPHPRSRWLVATEWLAANLGAPGLVVLDGSYYLPAMKRDAAAEYLAGHIPGALRFDIDEVADHSGALPHMLPSAPAFAAATGRLG